MAKKQENYLEYIPAISEKTSWDKDETGKVTIHMVHRGFFDRIAQRFFGRPRVSHIELDKYGCFLWLQIDGKKPVGELAQAMQAEFGAEAEPLYDRLVKYMQILRNNGFIYYAGKDRTPR